MFSNKSIKYVLLATIAVLLASNVITVKAICMYKKHVETSVSVIDDIYKQKCEELSRENQQLKDQLDILVVPAEKWNLYEKRYNKSSRSDSERNLKFKYRTTLKRMRVTAYTEYECDKDSNHPQFRITTSGNEKENCIDIYIPDQETVNNFGVKYLDVYIIHDVPDSEPK